MTKTAPTEITPSAKKALDLLAMIERTIEGLEAGTIQVAEANARAKLAIATQKVQAERRKIQEQARRPVSDTLVEWAE